MRKKRHEEHLNHEAWAIPYADLMTLLLAFFVVMYAVSVVNTGKYRVMSESLKDAFNGQPHVIVPLSASKASQAIPASAPAAANAPAAVISLPMPSHGSDTPSTAAEPPPKLSTLERIEDLVQQALQPLIDKKLVVLRRTPDRLEIEIRTDILFTSGEAKLSVSASKALVSVASILAPFPNALRVEGFTDNVPISTPTYPSNWELSAARAASVARLFAGHGVQSGRLGIVGWGDVRPIADNSTSDGRNHNRRVLVVVEADRNGSARAPGHADRLGQAPALSPLAADTSAPPAQAVAGNVALVAAIAGTAVPAGLPAAAAMSAPGPQANEAQAPTAAVTPDPKAAVSNVNPGDAGGGSGHDLSAARNR